MLLLAWPMILTNLGQTAMTATDVLMMGRLGPRALAAGSLGSNLYFAPLIFGLGLMLAVSPMIATELGRSRHSVRDVRRTVRQGLWIAIMVALPIWVLLWNAEAILRRDGPGAGARRACRRPMCARCNGRCCPSTATSCCAPSSRRWSGRGWALVIVFAAVAFNVLRQLVPDVRQSRLPGARPAGLRLGDDALQHC